MDHLAEQPGRPRVLVGRGDLVQLVTGLVQQVDDAHLAQHGQAQLGHLLQGQVMVQGGSERPPGLGEERQPGSGRRLTVAQHGALQRLTAQTRHREQEGALGVGKVAGRVEADDERAEAPALGGEGQDRERLGLAVAG